MGSVRHARVRQLRRQLRHGHRVSRRLCLVPRGVPRARQLVGPVRQDLFPGGELRGVRLPQWHACGRARGRAHSLRDGRQCGYPARREEPAGGAGVPQAVVSPGGGRARSDQQPHRTAAQAGGLLALRRPHPRGVPGGHRAGDGEQANHECPPWAASGGSRRVQPWRRTGPPPPDP